MESTCSPAHIFENLPNLNRQERGNLASFWTRELPIDEKIQLAKNLLLDCEKVYDTGDKTEDINSKQSVWAYRSSDSQKKYTHMYFAKHVSSWRDLRSRLAVSASEPVVSLGAGPCLCLLGWFWDERPAQPVSAFDVLSWKRIRKLTSHRELLHAVVGDVDYESSRFFPECAPPQLRTLPEFSRLSFLSPADLPSCGTLLIPYVLNHIIGSETPLDDPGQLFAWLEKARDRMERVVIMDMHYVSGDSWKDTSAFWDEIGKGLGVSGCPSALTVASISDFKCAYSKRGEWPSRRTSRFINDYTAVVGDASGWSYVS